MQTQQIGAIGIDFGSSRSVIGAAKKKGVDVIANQASSRETSNMVGYGEQERFLGEQGLARAKSNFKNTCAFSNRLLGLQADYPKLKEETKWITCKTGTNPDGKLCYEVTARGEKKQFTPIQVTASMLGELRKIITFNDLADKEAVISCPSYFTEAERKALLDAAKIADLKVYKLFSECSAVTLAYGLFRKNELPEKDKEARNVIFVDFGHSKLSSFVSSFTKEKCSVLLQEHERHLGARDFDWTLLKHYDSIFEKQHGLSILENKKSILRAIDAIQKQRKILSANQHAGISAECLVEDCDLHQDMNREEFEKLIAPDLERIKQNLLTLKAQIDAKKIKIHSVEIVGGASRTPAVQTLISEVFNQEICRSLNQTECIARGCAMMSAQLSPQFRVAEYKLEEANNTPVSVKWDFLNNGGIQEEGKTVCLFDKGSQVNVIKSLTFARKDGILVNTFYSPAPEGFNPDICTIKIPAIKPKEEDFGIKLRIKLNQNKVVELTESVLIEKYKVEEKVAKPKKEEDGDKKDKKEGDDKKDEEVEYEIKIKEKTRQTDITCEYVSTTALNAKQLEDQFNEEAEMCTHDRIIHETNAKKNELETYIYEWKDKISGKLAEYAEQSQMPELNKQLDEAQEWLDDNSSASKSQYGSRTEALQKLFEPIANRFKEYENLPHAYGELDMVLKTCEEFVNSSDAKWAHITPEDRQPVKAECEKIRTQLTNSQQVASTLAKHQDPPITVQEIQKLGQTLMILTQPIMAKPVPKPKEEEKVDEKKDEKKEGENKDASTEQKGEQQKDEKNENKMEEEK